MPKQDAGATGAAKREPEESSAGVGMVLVENDGGRIVVDHVLAGGPAAQHGILEGDVLAAVNGMKAYGAKMEETISKILGREGTPVRIDLERAGREVIVHLVRSHGLREQEVCHPASNQAKAHTQSTREDLLMYLLRARVLGYWSPWIISGGIILLKFLVIDVATLTS